MKIYNKSDFFRGLGCLLIAVASGAGGVLLHKGVYMLMALAWAGQAVFNLYRAMHEKRAGESREASARREAAARKLFGKWRSEWFWSCSPLHWRLFCARAGSPFC